VVANSGGGIPVQFQQTQVTTTNSFTPAGAYTDLGIAVSITPSVATSKVLVRACVNVGVGDINNIPMFQLLRGSTAIGVGTTVGSRTPCGAAVYDASVSTGKMYQVVLEWLDSPATTSSTTYKVQCMLQGAVTSTVVYLNRTAVDTNSAGYPRSVSVISAMEIK
jgi:hypothetical protein